MSKWSHAKRILHRVTHPNAHIRAAIRLGRMQINQEARMQLPPIFGGTPILIPVRAEALPHSEDTALWAAPGPDPRPYMLPVDTREAYHLRLQERRQLMRHSTSVIRKTILLSAADEPPPECETLHEIPAWLQ
jgi:hypothetical protein